MFDEDEVRQVKISSALAHHSSVCNEFSVASGRADPKTKQQNKIRAGIIIIDYNIKH